MEEPLKITDLEAEAISLSLGEFLRSPPNADVFTDVVEVTLREFTGAGFFTEFNETPHLKVFCGDRDFTGGGMGAVLNETIHVGFLLFIKKGYLNKLECYTYSDDWPSEITSYTFYGLPDSPANS
ncbi:MAG: hypothetical protein V7761_10425 [Amylibacter sp.]